MLSQSAMEDYYLAARLMEPQMHLAEWSEHIQAWKLCKFSMPGWVADEGYLHMPGGLKWGPK
jgi:hypothetical protein